MKTHRRAAIDAVSSVDRNGESVLDDSVVASVRRRKGGRVRQLRRLRSAAYERAAQQHKKMACILIVFLIAIIALVAYCAHHRDCLLCSELKFMLKPHFRPPLQ